MADWIMVEADVFDLRKRERERVREWRERKLKRNGERDLLLHKT